MATEASFGASEPGNSFIPRLWAARRIGELTRTIRVEGHSTVLIEEIRDLALRFGILTEYTSYLVQEPERLAETPPPLVQPLSAREQTGAREFERARRSANLRAAKTLQGSDELSAAAASDLVRGEGAPATRQAGDRLFVLRDSVWTDIRNPDRIPITAVAAFSPAYFELVRMLPEIVPYLSAGEQVLVTGRRSRVRISRQGVEAWKPGELAALVRNYRGT